MTAERLDQMELHFRKLALEGHDVAIELARLDGMRRMFGIGTALPPDPTGRDSAVDAAIETVRQAVHRHG